MTQTTTAVPTARQVRLILIGATLLLIIGMGIRQSFGLFLTPVTHDLAITAADFTMALAVQNIVWGVTQAFVGAIADRYGLRMTMLAGTVLFTAGLIVMALAQGPLALSISGALVGISLSCTATSLTMTSVVRAVSPARRSMTLGLVSAAGALGTLIGPLSAQSLLASGPWQNVVWLFVLVSIAMIPAAFMAGSADNIPGPANETASMGQVLGQAMRNRQFLVMSTAFFVCGLNLVFLMVHLPSYLVLCGQDPMLGAASLAIIGATSSIGSLVTGWLGGKYPKHVLLGLLYILRSVMIAIYFILPPSPASTVLFAVVMGLLWWPGLVPLISGLVADTFGTRYMATLLGISFVVHQVGSSLGAWGGGVIFDLYGSYDRAWQIGTIIGISAGLLQLFAGGPTRRPDRVPAPALEAA